MQDDHRLDEALARLGSGMERAVPEGFMDGVWERAGYLQEVSTRRVRLGLMVAMAFVGLGAGFSTTQAPANAETARFQLVDGADLSPAALLQVEP